MTFSKWENHPSAQSKIGNQGERRGKTFAVPLRPLRFMLHLYVVFLKQIHHNISGIICSNASRSHRETFRARRSSPLDGTQWKERFVERWCFQGSVQQLDQFFAQRRCRRSHRRLGGCWCFLAQLTLGDELMDLPQVFQTAGATTALLLAVITVK